MDKTLIKTAALRLVDIRASIVARQVFFGRLLMHLSYGFAPCGTAYTDMERIVFDPEFVSRLGDTELEFLLLHELMHCVLKHCARSLGKLQFLYNVACDIVVNSLILEAMGIDTLKVDGKEVMHLAPDGKEGSAYTAEEVYAQLLKKKNDDTADDGEEALVDSHDNWQTVGADDLLEEIWSKRIVTAGQKAGSGTYIPEGLERVIDEATREQKIDWRQVLADCIQHDSMDYSFAHPDKRYSGDFMLPSFMEDIAGMCVRNVWFVADTSGSVTTRALSEAFKEIKNAIDQIGSLSGSLSFFDCVVTEPVEFQSVEELERITPVGGGGTDFHAVFEAMKTYFEDELPETVIIMTDGFADFPDETAALGVNTVWLIVDSTIQAPWGKCIHIRS